MGYVFSLTVPGILCCLQVAGKRQVRDRQCFITFFLLVRALSLAKDLKVDEPVSYFPYHLIP